MVVSKIMLKQLKYKDTIFQVSIKDLTDELQKVWIEEKFYEQVLLEYIGQNFSGGTFIDIGACIGNHTLFFSSIADKVVSIEPRIESFLYIKEILEMNNVKNVDLYNVACSSSWGFCHMKMKIGGENNIGMYKVSQNIDFVNVALVPGDSVLSRYNDITVIKVDVEGYELEVLKGLVNSLKKWNPVLFVEIIDNPLVFEYLATLGYTEENKFNATPTYEFVKEKNV